MNPVEDLGDVFATRPSPPFDARFEGSPAFQSYAVEPGGAVVLVDNDEVDRATGDAMLVDLVASGAL